MTNALLSNVSTAKQRQPMCAECEKAMPKQIFFDKIESIIWAMQDEQNGLPVKTAKSFMSKIPSVFTGIDLIQWMMRNLKLDDQQEAIHLANLIASHGYIFPIEDHTLSIKNDCTFYRFQTPCLWPSNNGDPENTDYAVYLCKRTMQGKTRLELADYEAENLARLQKMFSRKWEFIFMQAESQAKVDKKRDKLERKVLDSQERAFWDVYRPVPGCVNTTELDIKKACRLSKSVKRCVECQKMASQSGSSSSTPGLETAKMEPGNPTSAVSEPADESPTTTDSGAPALDTERAAEQTAEGESSDKQNVKSESDTIGKQTELVNQPKQESTADKPKPDTEQVDLSTSRSHHHHHPHPHHHHHHYHYHHPHPHVHHHHHHHHRQCPHHKHNQQVTQGQQPQISIPTESILTTTVAASSGWTSSDKETSVDISEKQTGDQLIKPALVPHRRKSECNRMHSMAEAPEFEQQRLRDQSAMDRPASACCSFTSLDRDGATLRAGLRSTATLTGPPQVLRKSSLNIVRSSDADKSPTGGGGPRKSSIHLPHGQRSQLKETHSVCGSSPSDHAHIDELERELEALKMRLDSRIGGVKMSKVTQSYLSYFKQWAEYDPFIAQPIPSNPWISDSTELWDSERQTKDVHCRRVRRWAFSLKELLNDPAGRQQFHKFLEKEFSAENLKFWDVVQELKRVHSKDVARKVEAIWTEYLAQDANCPINIDSKSYETSKKNMAKNRNNRYIFDEAAGHVYQLMKNDSYPRYLRSDMYKDYKEASEKKRTNQVAFDVFKPQITTLKQKFNF